jgi:hypothetical protein
MDIENKKPRFRLFKTKGGWLFCHPFHQSFMVYKDKYTCDDWFIIHVQEDNNLKPG